jgi:ArsR family transcriptional regulator
MSSAAVPETSSPSNLDEEVSRHHLAERLRALGDPTRLRLLAALRAAPQQRACVSELTDATGLPQPTVSRHLQILHRAALLVRARNGTHTYYQVSTSALQAVTDDLID